MSKPKQTGEVISSYTQHIEKSVQVLVNCGNQAIEEVERRIEELEEELERLIAIRQMLVQKKSGRLREPTMKEAVKFTKSRKSRKLEATS